MQDWKILNSFITLPIYFQLNLNTNTERVNSLIVLFRNFRHLVLFQMIFVIWLCFWLWLYNTSHINEMSQDTHPYYQVTNHLALSIIILFNTQNKNILGSLFCHKKSLFTLIASTFSIQNLLQISIGYHHTMPSHRWVMQITSYLSFELLNHERIII